MGKGQSPQSEIGGGVGDRAQNILDGVDALVNEYLGELLFLFVGTATATMRAAIGNTTSFGIRSGSGNGLDLKNNSI